MSTKGASCACSFARCTYKLFASCVWFTLTFNCCSVVFTQRFAAESVIEGTNALDDSSRIVQLERDVRTLRKTLASKLWIYSHLSCSMDILYWNVARTIIVCIGTMLTSSQWNWRYRVVLTNMLALSDLFDQPCLHSVCVHYHAVVNYN